MRPLTLKLSGIPELALAPWWVVSPRVADCGARDPRLERASFCVEPVPDMACGRVRCVPKLLSACWWTGSDSSQLAEWPTVSWRRFQPAAGWDIGLEGSRASADPRSLRLLGPGISELESAHLWESHFLTWLACRPWGSKAGASPLEGGVISWDDWLRWSKYLRAGVANLMSRARAQKSFGLEPACCC